VFLPIGYLSAKPIKIEIGKRAISAGEIAHGTIQNRPRTDLIAG
jgi:hypothetical protein